MSKWLVLLLLLPLSLHAANKVTFKVSRPLCLLTFLEAPNGTGAVAPSLAAFMHNNITGSDGEHLDQLVKEFSSIGLDYSYTFTDYPQSRQHPKNVLHFITMAAVQCDSVDEFMQRIVGILPNEQWIKLKQILRGVAPIYDKYITAPYKEEVKEQLAAMQQFNDKVEDIFNKLKRFYGSTWSDDMPFTISIYPVPGKRGATSATPHANSLVLAMLTKESDYAMRAGIGVHEICHVLYEEQPLRLQQQLDSFFSHDTSAFAPYAYNYIDEGLATACGNGWAYKILSAHMDRTPWYNDDYIDGYAHALYPLVEEYIEAGRQIDEPFVTRAIKLFEQTFPGAVYDFPNLFNKISLYTDADDHQQFETINNILRQYFRISSCASSYPIADPQTIDLIKSTTGTQFFIIHAHHQENFEALKKIFPAMKGNQPDQAGIITFIDDKKRPVIILNVKDMNNLDDGIKQLAHIGRMDMQQFTPLH